MYSGGSIQTTRAGVQFSCLGSGKFKDWKEIRVCHDAVKNICSAGMLREMGYGLQLLRVPRVVRLVDGMEVLTASYSENGMPFVGLVELLNLPNINNGETLEEFHLTNKYYADPLDLLHERCGHFSKVKLLEAFKHMLFTGSGLERRHLPKQYKRSISRHLCKSRAKAKSHAGRFNHWVQTYLKLLSFWRK